MTGNEDERVRNTLDYGRDASEKRAPVWARAVGVLAGVFLLLLALNGLLWLHADILDISLELLIFISAALALWMGITGRAVGRNREDRRND